MPVDQTGETILFVLEEDAVEAHIQIEYDPDTDAQRFAWVIPVMALPEFSIGSQPLFDALLGASVPRYGSATWFEPCGGGFPEDPCSDSGGNADDGGVKLDVGGGSGEPPPEVVEHTFVGAFEIFVIEGGTPQSVTDWLEANDFAPDPDATPILAEYLDEGFQFVAMKLSVDAMAEEVHPVVLRMPVTEACVPMRLTRIAASDDLDLRTLFLSSSRVVPDSYKHVVLNDLMLDWSFNAANYREVVTLAVDEAGGRAFVTEYAGASNIVDTTGLLPLGWDPELFRETTWMEAIELMYGSGWVSCVPGPAAECTYGNPLLEGIIRDTFGLPAEHAVAELLVCPDCFVGEIDEAGWDPNALIDALYQRIMEPGWHAQDLLGRWPYLTRMYTTISPHEMTVDPTFLELPGLPDDATLLQQATLATFCDGERSAQLPDGRLIADASALGWPVIEAMPNAERIEQYNPAGAPVVEADNRDEIDVLLQQHNELEGPPRPPFGPACGDETGGFGTQFPGWETDGDESGRAIDQRRASGCACHSATTRSLPLHGLMLGLLGLMGLGRRRV